MIASAGAGAGTGNRTHAQTRTGRTGATTRAWTRRSRSRSRSRSCSRGLRSIRVHANAQRRVASGHRQPHMLHCFLNVSPTQILRDVHTRLVTVIGYCGVRSMLIAQTQTYSHFSKGVNDQIIIRNARTNLQQIVDTANGSINTSKMQRRVFVRVRHVYGAARTERASGILAQQLLKCHDIHIKQHNTIGIRAHSEH
jgi:hypothetical protein